MSGAASKVSAWARKYIGVAKRVRRYISREERAELMAELRAKKAFTIGRRERHCDTPLEFPAHEDASQAETFAGYHLEVCTRLERERRHAAVRDLNATALYRASDWLFWNPRPPPSTAVERQPFHYTPEDLRRMAERLMRARKNGHWGINTETGARVIRFFDRSGLPLLDPSEARRNAARISRRTIPVLMRYARAGYSLYYGVASEPNVPLGALKWGKRHLFRRVHRTLRKAFPEVVGVLAVQEDPLAGSQATWNVHVNLILVVNPRLCTRLTPATHRQLRLALGDGVIPFDDAAPVKLDRTPPGKLSYAKIHASWGSHQFYLEELVKPDEDGLRRALLELIKYSAKMASKKAIARTTDAAPGELDTAGAPAVDARERVPGAVDSNDDRAAARGADEERLLHLAPLDHERPPRRVRAPAAPGLAEYRPRELIEYLEANNRFRRVRTWGVLYGIEDEDQEDADRAGKIRWLGRVHVSPLRFSAEEAPLQFINSIHGDKSAPNSGSYIHPPALWQARAGPGTARGFP